MKIFLNGVEFVFSPSEGEKTIKAVLSDPRVVQQIVEHVVVNEELAGIEDIVSNGDNIDALFYELPCTQKSKGEDSCLI